MAVHERVWERGAADPGHGASTYAARPWRPEGTYALLGIFAGIWILQQIAGAITEAAIRALDTPTEIPFGIVVYNGHAFRLDDFLFVINTDIVTRPWTLITSTVAHDPTSISHILVNGLMLFFFGPAVERLVGTKRFLTLFFVGGAISGVLQVFLVANLWHPAGALGASGALMMLFGILMAILPNQRILVYGIVPVPFWIAGLGYAAIDLLGAINPASRIGNFAHLSGMALGLGYGLWQKQDWRRKGVRLVPH